MSNRYDTVVVGAGLGGCSAAAHLAALGHQVLLVERYTAIGGSSHVFRRQGRWEFDCGVHYVGDCGPGGQVPTLLRGLGLDDRIEWLPLERSGFDTIVAPGAEVRVPVGWDTFERNLLDTFPEDRRGLRRVVSVLRRLGESLDRGSDPGSVTAFGRAVARAGRAAPFALAPYVSLLVAAGLRPRTMLAMSVQNGTQAATPTTLSTLGHAAFLENYVGRGAYYPRGGGQMLAAGFAEVIRSHGGEIRTGTGVDRILVENRQVTGVRLESGETVRASTVVSAMDVLRTFRELIGPEHLPAATRARVRSWTMSQPLINGFFGVDLDLSAAPNTNHFVIPEWDDLTSLTALKRLGDRLIGGRGHTDGPAWAREFARSQPMFVQSSSRRDPSNRRAAPAQHATIEVQTIAPADPALWGFDGADVRSGGYRNDPRYREIKKIVLDGMLERMERAYPGSSGRVRLAELGTPATQERFVGNTAGAPFGLAPSPTQTGPMRPGPATPIRGLYLAGTSTPWGPATEGSMVSGLQAAAAITGRDLLAEVRAGAVLADRSLMSAWPDDFDPLAAGRGPATRQTASNSVDPSPSASSVDRTSPV
ncbi:MULTISPECIES: phytoene desaturase family protein [Pseudonocardia]|uniref:Phytoene desaturase (Lycopene-forming) n=2 Tax=Pseudonocardia TaxID=1847 RepID=A0A1Y2MP44_PSEAH|nr:MULTISPECIES: NAD(P)/FAD-dependent oxidoreductase [Pseudonocardia]OSY36457.1 Phytoene desaturase (lycopene-forming) [Pseudonocardia autotrophica]TDN74749.1 phytoene dehydrogenase-like protein [Pseudonocardia autotrophica]BBG05524.1 phytoene dehydrogenase [Pseudonocardia autotrophica]GEC28049.1 phytoene dehydrogenase [Pseudonocardia saturnea]